MAVIATRRVLGNSRSSGRTGLSLIESLLSVLIVSVMLVAVLNTLGSLALGRIIQATQCTGSALGRQLMTEIFQCHYSEPDDTPAFGLEDSESGSSRANYDDVDDYNGWSASSVQTKDGTAISNLTGWQRSVTVQYADPDNVTSTAGSDQGLKRIIVTVTDPRGAETTLVALRCSTSIYDQSVTSDTTYLTWAGVELQIGSDTEAKLVSGANILNQVQVGGQ